MHIRLNIEMRCARRQNDAAYQQYRRRSVSGRHAIIIHRRQVQHQSSRGMFLTLWMARMPLRHRPIVLRSPVNGSESAIGRGCIRATGWDAFLLKPLLRVPYVYSAYRTQPKYNILTGTPKIELAALTPLRYSPENAYPRRAASTPGCEFCTKRRGKVPKTTRQSPKNTWFCTIRPKCAQFNKKHGFRKKPKVVMDLGARRRRPRAPQPIMMAGWQPRMVAAAQPRAPAVQPRA